MPKLFTMLAYQISRQLTDRKETYESSAYYLNQKYTEDLQTQADSYDCALKQPKRPNIKNNSNKGDINVIIDMGAEIEAASAKRAMNQKAQNVQQIDEQSEESAREYIWESDNIISCLEVMTVIILNKYIFY